MIFLWECAPSCSFQHFALISQESNGTHLQSIFNLFTSLWSLLFCPFKHDYLIFDYLIMPAMVFIYVARVVPKWLAIFLHLSLVFANHYFPKQLLDVACNVKVMPLKESICWLYRQLLHRNSHYILFSNSRQQLFCTLWEETSGLWSINIPNSIKCNCIWVQGIKRFSTEISTSKNMLNTGVFRPMSLNILNNRHIQNW